MDRNSHTQGAQVYWTEVIRRHSLLVSAVIGTTVVALIAVVVAVRYWTRPAPECGPGLVAVDRPYRCAGLDMNSGPLQAKDPLAAWEGMMATANAAIVASTVETIVLLENATPDPARDTYSFGSLVHAIEGALTAQDERNWIYDTQGHRRPQQVQFRMLLANDGAGAESQAIAVDRIQASAADLHIVAVAGLGQSVANTRTAARTLLSDPNHPIAVVGGEVTGDNLNKQSDSKGAAPIPGFYRVGPVNSDEGSAAAQYIKHANIPHDRTLLVVDQNPLDDYGSTLASGFLGANKVTPALQRTFSYTGGNRDEALIGDFGDMHGDICALNPDLVYFAGRGSDLRDFVTALLQGGPCADQSPLTIVSGDDTSNLVGREVYNYSSPPNGFGFPSMQMFFTGVAAGDEWKNANAEPQAETLSETTAYDTFASSFSRQKFPPVGTETTDDARLADGVAMIVHDSVAVAGTAAQRNPSATNLIDLIKHFECTSAFAGAAGYISLDEGTNNPRDKVMPVLQLDASGATVVRALEWPQGAQINYSALAEC